MENSNRLLQKLKIDKSNWKLFKFGDVAIQSKKKVDRENTNLKRYIKGDHMESEDLHIRNWGELTDEYLGPAFTREFIKGDILYGSRRTYLRKVSVAQFSGITSNTTFVIKHNEENIARELLPFLMLSDGFADNSIKNSKGSVNPYINWKDIAKYQFLLPQKKEQTKLANFLLSIDKLVESNIQLLSKIQNLYLSLIEKELINKSFKKVLFSTLGKVVKGVGYKPNELLDNYDKNSCILLRSNNIFDEKINYDDVKLLSANKVKGEQFLQDNDFAICMSNGSKDLVGKTAKYLNNSKKVTIGSFCACFRAKDKYTAKILEHLFVSNSYRYEIKKTLTGSTINNLKPSDIEGLSLRINPKMKNFDDLMKKLNSLADSKVQVKNSIKIRRQLLKNIINQIFNNV